MFPGRYRPSQEDFERLWHEGLFVLDTNVLLSLYRRYFSPYRTELLSVLRSVKDRLWLPHQVAHEYLKDRLKVIDEVRATYAAVREQLSTAREDAATEKAERFLGSSEAYFADLEARFPKSSNEPDEDEIWSAVDELFAGRIGAVYDSEARAKIFGEGKQRYADRIPPGFRDQGKSKDEEKYGDLLLWFQMLDKAEQEARPILFVTNDQKEDWWWKSQGKVIGPRGELVEEMRRRAGVPLYMYQSDRFMEQAGTFLNQQVSKEAIQDAHELAMLEAEEEREEALRELAGAVAAGAATEALEMGTAQIPSPSVLPDVAAAHAARELLNSPEAEAAREFLNSPAAQAAREFMNSPQAQAAREFMDSPAAQAARKALDSPEVREMRRLMNSPEMQEFRRMQRYFKHQGL